MAGFGDEIGDKLDRVARNSGFSGVVGIAEGGQPVVHAAYGLADRAHDVPNTVETRFAIASGTKGFTALAVMALVEQGVLAQTTTARSLLGPDLPMIDDAVTIEHLLAHTSGIGDYLDESEGEIDDYVLTVPLHTLDSVEAWLPVLVGHAQVSAPGLQFAYNNAGYVVLALLAERAAGVPYAELVTRTVCDPAGLTHTSFHRSDTPAPDLAIGYLGDGPRMNVLHLPLVGAGDGGLSSTLTDLDRFWRALFAGRIVRTDTVAEMVRPHQHAPEHGLRYGLGFWLAASGPAVMLEGYDAGISFRSTHDPVRHRTTTVISNTSEGAWPIARLLADRAD